jgi:hypothetical protein
VEKPAKFTCYAAFMKGHSPLGNKHASGRKTNAANTTLGTKNSIFKKNEIKFWGNPIEIR